MARETIYRDFGPHENEYDSRLLHALSDEDDLIASVVGQTYVEFYLLQLVRVSLVDATALGEKAAGMTFRHLLPLGIALGQVHPSLSKMLKQLSEIRNAFGHSIAHEITSSDVAALRKTIPQGLSDDMRLSRNVMYEFDSFPAMSKHAQEFRETVLTAAFHLAMRARSGTGFLG